MSVRSVDKFALKILKALSVPPNNVCSVAIICDAGDLPKIHIKMIAMDEVVNGEIVKVVKRYTLQSDEDSNG